MTEGLNGIIAQLEQQKAAIEQALSALRGAGRTPAAAPVARTGAKPGPKPGTTTGHKRRLTPEGRRRLAEAMRRRWAVKRAPAQVVKATKKAAAKKSA